MGIYRLLVLDSYDSHHLADFKLYCQEHNIITLYIPPHLLYILQPLDIGCFSPLKTAYRKQIKGFIYSSQIYITKEDFFPAFKVVFQEVITLQNIQGGFRGAGITPISPEKVLEGLGISSSCLTTAQSRPQTA